MDFYVGINIIQQHFLTKWRHVSATLLTAGDLLHVESHCYPRRERQVNCRLEAAMENHL